MRQARRSFLKGLKALPKSKLRTLLPQPQRYRIVLLAVALSGLLSHAAERRVIESIGEISRLTNEAKNAGLPVHARATVLRYDPQAFHFFVRDSEGAVYVNLDRSQWDVFSALARRSD